MKNKNERNRHELKKERQFRKTVLAILVIIGAICLGLIYIQTHAKPNTVNADEQVATTENELEQYIIGKVTTNDVLPGSIPVLIYRFNPDSGVSSVAGSGTVFTGSNGTQLITSAHIFSIENNGMSNQYAIRKLRPLEGHLVDCGIEGFMPDEQNIPNYRDAGFDAVLCKVGTHPQMIKSFYTGDREKKENLKIIDISPLNETKTIRSIVSGEDVHVLGWSASSNGLSYFTIMYKSRGGESGTGFVDSNGLRYVLKGKMDSLSVTPEAEKQLGYPLHSSYSVVVGPFKKQ